MGSIEGAAGEGAGAACPTVPELAHVARGTRVRANRTSGALTFAALPHMVERHDWTRWSDDDAVDGGPDLLRDAEPSRARPRDRSGGAARGALRRQHPDLHGSGRALFDLGEVRDQREPVLELAPAHRHLRAHR